MGQIFSIFNNMFTTDFCSAEDFMDISKNQKVLAAMKNMNKKELTEALLLCDFDEIYDKFVDFVEEYLDTTKLIEGHHSESWVEALPEDPTEKRGAIKDVVIKTLEVGTRDKDDKNLGKYIKRVLSNFTGSFLGGFLVDDQRKTKDTKTMSYLKARKHLLKKRYFQIAKDGFVFCPEDDQEPITDIPGVKCLVLDERIHFGNSSKKIYHSADLEVRPLSKDELIARMTEKGFDTSKYEAFQDRFAVVQIQGPKGSLFETPYFAVCCHLKSCGNKKDITEKNLDEYAFVKTVIASFDGDMILCGDFNAPVFEEGIEHFGLEEKDRENYPIQDGGKNSVFNLTFGFIRMSNYAQDDVAFKIRSTHSGINNQAVLEKYGERHYNTDHVFMRHSQGMKMDHSSTLFPLPRDGEKLILPRLDGTDEGDHPSDHQAVHTYANGTFIGVYNVLSDCCSDDQPFLDSLSGEDVKEAQTSICELIAETTNKIMEGYEINSATQEDE